MDLGEFLARLLQKLILFAVLGFILIMTAGFLFTLAAYLLTFALIGFLLYLPFHSALWGRQIRWTEVVQKPWVWSRNGIQRLFPKARPEQWPARIRGRWQRIRRYLVPVLLETICGAALGCLIVLLRNRQFVEEPWPVLLGAALGALAGFWIGYRQMAQQDKSPSGENGE